MYMCDIYRYLEQAGLCARNDKGEIVWSRTRVYLKGDRGGLELFVNLQGREPHGIVPLAEYDQVQEKILHLLGSWHVMENENVRNAVGLALKKQDAAAIGFWGDNAGDVIFAYNTGFVWGVSADGAVIAPVEKAGANHGPQKPTAETEVSSNYGVVIMYGSGIRNGFIRDRLRNGPHKMVDPAATIACLLDIKPKFLKHIHGTVMADLLQEAEVEQGGVRD
jgi:predicted AlkP superfamily phosphohydrolase/phosphomutase